MRYGYNLYYDGKKRKGLNKLNRKLKALVFIFAFMQNSEAFEMRTLLAKKKLDRPRMNYYKNRKDTHAFLYSTVLKRNLMLGKEKISVRREKDTGQRRYEMFRYRRKRRR